MRLLIASLSLCLVLTGCAVQQPYARVNDVAVGDSGYLLVSVDGAPVRRASAAVPTLAPVAVVAEGSHTFELQNKRDPHAPPTKISGAVKGGREYRFAPKDNTVVLVETFQGQPEPQSASEGDWILNALLGM